MKLLTFHFSSKCRRSWNDLVDVSISWLFSPSRGLLVSLCCRAAEASTTPVGWWVRDLNCHPGHMTDPASISSALQQGCSLHRILGGLIYFEFFSPYVRKVNANKQHEEHLVPKKKWRGSTGAETLLHSNMVRIPLRFTEQNSWFWTVADKRSSSWKNLSSLEIHQYLLKTTFICVTLLSLPFPRSLNQKRLTKCVTWIKSQHRNSLFYNNVRLIYNLCFVAWLFRRFYGLTVTPGPSRATTMLTWPSVEVSSTPDMKPRSHTSEKTWTRLMENTRTLMWNLTGTLSDTYWYMTTHVCCWLFLMVIVVIYAALLLCNCGSNKRLFSS